MSITYKENLDNIDYKELNKLLRDVLGEEKAQDEQHTRKAFENSRYFVFAYEDDRLIGAVRALSDGDWAVIYNFAVLTDYEGTDIEKEILARLVHQLKGQHIFTNARPGSIAFYEANGFQRTKTAFTYVGYEGAEKNYPEGYFLPLNYRFENEFYKTQLPFPTLNIAKKKDDVKLTYTNSRDGVDYARVNEIIVKAFGSNRSRNENDFSPEKIAKTKHLFDISEYVSFAYDRDNLVGVARAITDGVEEAYIQNVAVDPDYQGHGIGWKVVVNLSEEIQKNGLNPFLHTHPGAVGFYNRKGFLRNKMALDYRKYDDNLPPMPTVIETGFYVPVGYRFENEIIYDN